MVANLIQAFNHTRAKLQLATQSIIVKNCKTGIEEIYSL